MTIDCSRIAEALASYDPDAHEADSDKAEEHRAALLAHFSRGGWPAMTLDRYALGRPLNNRDNFCYWMEFVVTQTGSMRGGSARKHLIYFQATTGQ